MREWVQSIKELKKKADERYYEEDFVSLCLIGRKMAEQLSLILRQICDSEDDVGDIMRFFSKYVGEEDMFKPYLASLWGGIPDREEGKKCMEFIERIVIIAENLANSA